MEIIDLDGKAIKVMDLDLAILQADDYRHYCHADPVHAEQDRVLQAYWQDVYEKLIRMRS
jgi:hypothetical protein